MTPGDRLSALAERAARRPWSTLAVWAFAVLLAVCVSIMVPGRMHGGVDSVPGTPSWRVERALATEFESPFAQVVVVAVRPIGNDVAPAHAAAADLLRLLAHDSDVRRVDYLPG